LYILLLPLLLTSCLAPGDPAATQTSPATVTVTATATGTAAVTLTATVTPTSTSTAPPTATYTPTPTFTPTPEPVARFAVIGDYGAGGQEEADVATLVDSWGVEFILTVGDNNYPEGDESTIDQNIGQFYSEYIAPYRGLYGEGAAENRFFPTLGNHDYMRPGAEPYLDYFELPGNERYYDFTWGPVHFFALNSDSNEPDGVGAGSRQAEWLRQGLAASTAPWQIVYFHHAPYSSGMHGPVDWARWPYAGWGADAVLSGHNHTYERLQVDGIPYFVNGLGGGAIYYFDVIDPHSQVRFANDWGAMLVEASGAGITFQFITRTGAVIDTLSIGE
jgi:hypothetical protein